MVNGEIPLRRTCKPVTKQSALEAPATRGHGLRTMSLCLLPTLSDLVRWSPVPTYQNMAQPGLQRFRENRQFKRCAHVAVGSSGE